MTINNCFIEASNDYDDISKELNKISTDGFINNSLFTSLLFESISKHLQNRTSNNESFVKAFIESLPDSLRTKIQNDSSYITYLAKSIEEELLAYDKTSHISSALSKKINDIIHDESSESLKDTVIKSTLKVFDTKVNEILEDGIIDEKGIKDLL